MGYGEATALVISLRACTKNKDLCRGIRIHGDILRNGFIEICFDALVTMYAKCGALAKAKQLLDVHTSRDVFTWTALISGYVQNGQSQDALTCFQQMQQEGLPPDAVTYSCVFKACGSIGALEKGQKLHDDVAYQGLLKSNIVLGTALVDMYAKCGALGKAQHVLEELPVRDIVTWSALIAGYAQHGQGEQALNCFEQMQREHLFPDVSTFASILKACGNIGATQKGERVHLAIARRGLLDNDLVLGNALVDMYAKCGALDKAHGVLEGLTMRDVISWNALIGGYAQHGKGEEAMNCLEQMNLEGILPNAVTFACILKACSSTGAADKREEYHCEMVRQGLVKNNTVLGIALIDMYAKCGALIKARGVLDELPIRNTVAWNALIAGYADHGGIEEAIECVDQMESECVSPDAITLGCILKACGSNGATEKEIPLDDEIIRRGFHVNSTILGNALVDMYAKKGAFTIAQQVLEKLPVRNVISWSTIIAGYAQHGQGESSLSCYERMCGEGLLPNAVTLACLLKACGSIGAVDKGTKLHDEIVRRGYLADNLVLGNALVDMYAKCGALSKAQQVLEELPIRDNVTWSPLIAGYAQQGQGERALSCFEQMQQEGLSPNVDWFLCILHACSLSGLVETACAFFIAMIARLGLEPGLKHYTCMVDLFARAGHVDKAVEVFERMPSSCSAVWSALLGACRKWGDVQVGRWAYEQAIRADRNDGVPYVLMAGIYAAVGMQEDAEKIEALGIQAKSVEGPTYSSLVFLER